MKFTPECNIDWWLGETEKGWVEEAIREAKGDAASAAALLGVPYDYTRFYRRTKRLGLVQYRQEVAGGKTVVLVDPDLEARMRRINGMVADLRAAGRAESRGGQFVPSDLPRDGVWRGPVGRVFQ